MLDPISLALSIAGFVGPKLVAKLAGEKAGEVATQVLDVAKRVTGNEDPAQAVEAIKADRVLQAQFILDGRKLDNELEAMFLADRQDARHRDVEYVKAGQHNWRADVLAIGAFGLLAVLTIGLLFRQVPEGLSRDILLMLIGALVIIVKDVFGFEFGSSRGSSQHAETIREMMKSGH